MSTSPLVFTGVSSFSNDFQSILSRAHAIAQIPITALQNQQADLLQKEQAATSLQSAMSDLATSVTNLGNVGKSAGISTTSSDSSTVAVTYSGLTTPQSFAITNITSVASAATESTLTGYADETTAAVGSGTYRLVVGGTTYPPLTSSPITLDASHNNLDGLRDAINALGAGVTATVLNSGNGATPYYLSISANATGQNGIQLVDQGTSQNVLTALNPGANADFYLNGTHVTSASNLISNAVPNLTFTIKDTTAGNQTVTLSAAQNSSNLAGAVQDFVAKYNAVEKQLSSQTGPAGGLLSGDYLIYGIQNVMRGLLNYNGPASGAIKNLTDLGIEMDSSGNGQMNFNSARFNALTPAQISGAFTFLGSTTSGFGGLLAGIQQFTDPVKGAIQAEQNQFNKTYDNLKSQITKLTDRADLLQAALQAELRQADTLVAHLQSEQQLLTASIQSLNFSSFGYQNTNPTTFAPNTGSGS